MDLTWQCALMDCAPQYSTCAIPVTRRATNSRSWAMVHLGSSNLENSDGSACDQLPTGEKYSTDCFACTRPLHARRSTNNAFGPRANAVSTAHRSSTCPAVRRMEL